MKRKYIILTAIAALLVAFSATTSFVKSISGTVVDAETGKPVEGAAVLVEWTRREGIGDYHTVSVRVAETVTDKAGMFTAFGPLHPFVDPPDVTIYKKGYVAWNNKRIFPDYRNRQKMEYLKLSIKLEHFIGLYSYDQHVSFILTCTNAALASNKKRKFEAAYEWERDLARGEVKQKMPHKGGI
jgi:hypothetical protein